MSNTSNPASGSDAGSHFTVEDAGSTTDASDLFHNDTSRDAAPRDASTSSRTRATPDEDPVAAADEVAAAGAAGRASDPGSDPGTPSAPGAPEPPSAPTGLGSADDDFAVGHVFDQTNGIIDDLDGDSDGSAESDVLSKEERADENPAFESFADSEVQPQDGVDDSRRTGA